MSKYLRRLQFAGDVPINLAMKDIQSFSLNTITDAFELEREKLEFGGVAKIQVHLTGDSQKDEQQEELIDAVLIYKYLDISEFVTKSEKEQWIDLCELLNDALKSVAKTYQVDLNGLDSVIASVIQKYGNFSGWIGAEKLNTNKTCGVRLYYRYGKSIEVGCHIRSMEEGAEGSASTIILFYHTPVLEPVLKLFGKLTWDGNTKFIIPRKNTRDFWVVDVSERRVEFMFDRAIKGQPHGWYDLGLMYVNGVLVLPDNEKAKWCFEEALRLGYKKAEGALENLSRETK